MSNIFNKFKSSMAKKKSADVSFEGATPDFWVCTGNYVINKIMSGRYLLGVPQGRVTGLSGPSSSGKSFILANLMVSMQKMGGHVFIVDAEHALDERYLEAVGVNTTDPSLYTYVSVSGLEAGTKVVQEILSMYKTAKTNEEEVPKMLLAVDSLDYLIPKNVLETYEKSGELSNDQGIIAKKHKQFLMLLNNDIKHLQVAAVVTKQVYASQDMYEIPPWKMAESVKYVFSQLFLFTRLFSKNKTTKEIDGIRLKVFGWKTRFTKPFQRCEITVPYDTGLDPYEGLLDVAVSAGVVEQNGAWYSFGDEKFQSKNWDTVKEAVLQKLIELEDSTEILIESDDYVEESGDAPKKKAKAAKTKKALEKVIDGEDEGE